MCIRRTYYCHSCRHCFDILLLSMFCLKFDKFTRKYLCCYFQPVNVVVERLCSDVNCLRQTKEGALAGVVDSLWVAGDVAASAKPNGARWKLCACHA